LAESPLPESAKSELARLNGAETRLLGELVGSDVCRVYGRPGSAGIKTTEALTRDAESGVLAAQDWRASLDGAIGWNEDGTRALPLGQGIGLAAAYRRQYRSVGRLVQAVRRAAATQIEQAARLRILDESG